MKTKKLPIPKFKSISEEAEFWDTHDSEDYKWEEAPDVVFSKNLRSVYEGMFPITVDKKTQKAIEKVAKKRRIDVLDAAQLLLRERLQQLNVV